VSSLDLIALKTADESTQICGLWTEASRVKFEVGDLFSFGGLANSEVGR
jgi:hypothetical protein